MDPAIVFPRPGANLDGAIQTFRWDLGGIPVELTWLYAGSSAGASDYGRRQVGADTEGSLGDLPADGSSVFVRVWYKTGGQWFSIDATYGAATSDGLPTFTRPVANAALAGTTQEFRWRAGRLAVDAWWLYLGTEPGGSELAAVQSGPATGGGTVSATVGGLPTADAGATDTLAARLYYLVGGSWYFHDTEFRLAPTRVPTRAELTRELQRLVGETADGVIGPRTRAALNRNWLGPVDGFDASFAARFANDPDLVRWVQERVVTRGGPDLRVTGTYDTETAAAVAEHLGRRGVVAVESYLELLDP
ncbi:MAG: hypothetical protein AAF547_13720 [Actinomycetota bacterium]